MSVNLRSPSRRLSSLLGLAAPALVAALAAPAFTSHEAYATSFRIVGGAGYESLQGEKDDDDEKEPKANTGFTLGVLGEVGFLDSTPGFALLAGGGLRYASLTAKEDDFETTLKPIMLAAEFGAEFSVVPMLRLQGLLGYDYGVAGSVNLKADALDIDEDFDFDKFGRFAVSGRALFTVAPMVSLGLEPTWYTGSLKIKEEDGLETEDEKFTGWAVKAVAQFTL